MPVFQGGYDGFRVRNGGPKEVLNLGDGGKLGGYAVLHAVEGENVNKDPLMEGGAQTAELWFCAGGPAVPDFGEGPQEPVCIGILEKVRFLKFLRGNGLEFFVVVPEHDQVNIVVPGDKALMAYRPQKRAVVGIVG